MMAFIDLLINETSLKFELGNKSIAVVSALISTMSNRDLGGIEGFLDLFRVAGFSPEVAEWVNGNSQILLTPSEIQTALPEEILQGLIEKTGIPHPLLSEILAFQIPSIICHLSSRQLTSLMRPDDIRKALCAVPYDAPGNELQIPNPTIQMKPERSLSSRIFRSIPFVSNYLSQ
jgi:uncharacterized protein YidB (DUF937 family)